MTFGGLDTLRAFLHLCGVAVGALQGLIGLALELGGPVHRVGTYLGPGGPPGLRLQLLTLVIQEDLLAAQGVELADAVSLAVGPGRHVLGHLAVHRRGLLQARLERLNLQSQALHSLQAAPKAVGVAAQLADLPVQTDVALRPRAEALGLLQTRGGVRECLAAQLQLCLGPGACGVVCPGPSKLAFHRLASSDGGRELPGVLRGLTLAAPFQIGDGAVQLGQDVAHGQSLHPPGQ